MSSLVHWISEPVPETFSAPQGASRVPPWALAVLVGLALVPRAGLAIRSQTVCDDAFYYVATAEAVARGDRSQSLEYLSFNVYPFLLAAAHGVGLEWFTAGKVLSVAASSLVVLPLFGWVRRLFDDRIGLAAAFLYGIHPKLIELGVEPVREPVFWLFFSTAMWLTLRACRGEGLRWHVAGGLAAALAIYTRSEGWLLAIPLAMWSAAAAISSREGRLRKIAGGAIWLAMIPGIALLGNLTLLRASDDWQWGRLRMGPDVAMEAAEEGGHSGAAAAGGSRISAEGMLRLAGRAYEIPPLSRRGRQFFLHSAKTLGPAVCVLMLASLILRRRAFLRFEVLPLLAMSACLLLAIWVKYARTGVMNGRYFSTINLMAAPLDAVGFVLLLRRLATQGFRLGDGLASLSWVRPSLAACLLVLGSLGFGWGYSMRGEHPGRLSQVRLGRALRSCVAPGQSVFADPRSIRIGYEAWGRMPRPLDFYSHFDVHFAADRPAVIVLSEDLMRPAQRETAIASAVPLGLVPLEKSKQPRDLRDYTILVPASLRGRIAADVRERR